MKPRQLQGPPRKTLKLRIKKLRGKKWSVIVAKLKEFCKIEGAYFLLPAQDDLFKKIFRIKCLWMKLQLYWRSQFGLRDSSKGISGDAAIFKYRGWIKLQACSKNTKMLGQQVPLRGRVITTMCNTPSLCLSSTQESEQFTNTMIIINMIPGSSQRQRLAKKSRSWENKSRKGKERVQQHLEFENC